MTVLNMVLKLTTIENIVVNSQLISADNTIKVGSVWSTG